MHLRTPIRNRHPSPWEGRLFLLSSIHDQALNTKTALKWLILRHPDWSADDLMAELENSTFEVPTHFASAQSGAGSRRTFVSSKRWE